MARIYTRTGDSGETGLFDGTRVPKDAPRVEAYGEVDELNAVLGLALAFIRDDEELRACLLAVQRDLFVIGAHLADPSARVEAKRGEKASLDAEKVAQLERWIDQFEAQLPPLRQFILPGGSKGGATLHLARTVCRRAERRIVALSRQVAVPPVVIMYMNRLSDLLFVAARLENLRRGHAELPW
ncbi:MAG: ATP--cob(I)alamin adenosyltransferase [Candidatus Tectimicrobiota bacterium]|nr:MAG: ATP--cob(I)alamin adenosyltransferase [Candidatus Tectomicrobia bacterium]